VSGCTEGCCARQAALEDTRAKAAAGAARVAARLREVEEARKVETVQLVVMRDALERISWLPHDHGTAASPKPRAKCIALASLDPQP
jgi:hypothetical protein